LIILGISAFYHDSAACVIKDGAIMAAAQEERFSRVKHDSSFPKQSIQYCLDFINANIEEVSYISYYENPLLKFDRLIKTYLSFAPKGFNKFISSMQTWVIKKLWIKQYIRKQLKINIPILFPEHHMSHAAGAFFPSSFDSSAFLTMDGVGEWTTLSYGVGSGNNINIMGELKFPHSLGLLYSAFTYYCGFRVNSGEYKLMGLAPYGSPIYKDLILDNIINLKDDGSFKLNMEYFDYCIGSVMTSNKFNKLFDRKRRDPESDIAQLDMDLASSIQSVIEDIVLKIANHVKKETGNDNLCLSGGVALNCVANGLLYKNGPFKRIWIQPAAGDAGSAIGAAMWVWHMVLNNDRKPINEFDRQLGSCLGPSFSSEQVKEFLDDNEIPYLYIEDEDDLCSKVSSLIANEKVVGWFQGRMEFGPRALGSRSILGDPRSKNMQSIMNLKIKYRESFRPFAPMVRIENVGEWFEISSKSGIKNEFSSPYMLLVCKVKSNKLIDNGHLKHNLDDINSIRSVIPAVTHVDNSARIQTVDQHMNSRLHKLLTSFYNDTECPILINTSFNVRGEPIVQNPEDAYRCFMRTEIDYLVVENFLLKKIDQPKYVEKADWRNIFKLD
jgi:carbamoyltransferase